MEAEQPEVEYSLFYDAEIEQLEFDVLVNKRLADWVMIPPSVFFEALPKLIKEFVRFNPQKELEIFDLVLQLSTDIFNDRQERKAEERRKTGKIRRHDSSQKGTSDFKRRHE